MSAGPAPATTPGAGGEAGELDHDVADAVEEAALLGSETPFHGRKWDVVADSVDLGGGTDPLRREYVRHPGAVGVVALDECDGVEHVLLIAQYRHPVRMRLWELPAGLLDEPGEDPAAAAARELAEEADLAAHDYRVLVDWFTSPGGSDEAMRLFLARDLAPVADAERHARADEEAGIEARWVPLDAAVAAVLAGRVHNAGAVVGLLAAAAARAAGWQTLRPAHTPWPQHPDRRPVPAPPVTAQQPGRGDPSP